MASATRPTSSLPPKVPLTSSISDPLAKAKRPVARAPSAGSYSVTSETSREGLRREILKRRKSLSESEFQFLQGVVAKGTEVEVTLAQSKLNDPSLCFDVDDDYNSVTGSDTEGGGAVGGDSRRSSLGSVHTPIQQVSQPNACPQPPSMVGQLLCPTLSMEENTVGEFDPEASIDTCATGRGKPPAMPIPFSPRHIANSQVPTHLELYGDDRPAARGLGYPDPEQTPLVQNLRPPKSLEGAAYLPIPGSMMMTDEQEQDYSNLLTPATNNTSLGRPAALQHRRSSNPLVDQLWRAHEQGLVVTPQQSHKRIQIRREQSLSALSPLMRRYSTSTNRTLSISSRSSSNKSSDSHARSLLNPNELRLIKQRHFHTPNQISSAADLLSSQQPWDAKAMMMVLQNASTDSTEHSAQDISSLLLPTDEEIFRRSQQLARPPPPRPFGKPPASRPISRMASDGQGMPRRPSALRRFTSDGSAQRSKSVSFLIESKPSVEELNMEDSISTFASAHPVNEILREPGSASAWARRDSSGGGSIVSLNLHPSRPIRSESIGSTASGWEAAYAFRRGLEVGKPAMNRKDSINSVASLNLHRAHPLRQESIGSTASGWEAAYAFQQGLEVGKPSMNRKDSINSVASMNLHRAHPLRQESIGSTTEGFDANRRFQEQLGLPMHLQYDNNDPTSPRSSVASLNLHMARPLRQESIGSVATTGTETEGSALAAFRRQFSAGKGFGRRESLSSLASLDLHFATPIIQDSIFQRQDSFDSTVAGEGPNVAEAFRPSGWARRESMSSVASMDLHRAHALSSWTTRESIASLASLRLELAHPIRKDSIASAAAASSAVESLREDIAAQSWGRRDSCASIASLNIHHSRPIRQSISSNAAGFDATESFRKEYEVDSTVLKPTWGRQSSIGSIASLNLHHAHALGSESGAPAFLDILRNKGSAFVSEGDLGELSLNSIPPVTKELLKKEAGGVSGATLRAASPGTVLSSVSDINLQDASLTSIPSLHPGRPLRQESIASTATGVEAKERLRQQVCDASIVASEWEEDKSEEKKTEHENDDHLALKAKDAPRPVMMRLASNTEWDEEGMEVAAVDELVEDLNQENSTQLKLKMQILVPSQPEGAPRRDSGSMPTKEQAANLPERELSTEGKRRQENFHHFPSSLASSGVDSSGRTGSAFDGKASSHVVEVSASFDESKSVDRFRGIFRGNLPRSLSEDELSAMLVSHSKPRPLSRGQSDATQYPQDLASSSWELDTIVGEYDAWDAIRDDYINGYGGGGTLPFKILGTSARDVDAQPHVLSPPLMESLQSFFPIAKSQDNYWMKYSMVRDGASLHTLMQRSRGARYSVLAIETVDGEVFGAFTTEAWRKTWNYFGSGESFLWRMRNSRKTQCYSIIDQAAMESEIDVYPYTAANQNIQLCTHTMIAVGGGTPEHVEAEEKRDDNDDHQKSADIDKDADIKDHEWGYGLALQADLQHGTSSPCLTFGSPSLSFAHSDGSVFEISNVELWTLTPCSNLMDAEKLELGRLFLDEQQPYR